LVSTKTARPPAMRHREVVSFHRALAVGWFVVALTAASVASAQRTAVDPRYDLIVADLLATPEGLALLEAFRTLRRDYLGEVDDATLLEGALRGMVGALDDPYVRYLGPDEAAAERRAARDPDVFEVARLDGLGYLGLASFDSERAGERLATELQGLLDLGIDGLVLDLRGNAGGFVLGGLQVLDLFLSDIVLGFRETRFGLIPLGYANPRAAVLPLAVLVDRDTASTAEIVAGALQTTARARLYGEVTAGKGVGQSTVPLSHGGELRVVTFAWSLPDGRSIEGWGLTPDVPVRAQGRGPAVATDLALVVAEPDRDPVLAAALRDLGRVARQERAAEPPPSPPPPPVAAPTAPLADPRP
jgi:C-terminal processing protease CtpA/Prc